MKRRHAEGLILVSLVLITIALFWRVWNYQFVGLDDNAYITENARIQQGINWDNFKWAFHGSHIGFWHPLTLLSHMLDCHLFGLNSGGHHLTSVLLHVANSCLLFILLKRMTSIAPAAIVATLFAWHPLHVESVAWIAERKDVLSTFFWMLTLLSYWDYVKNPSRRTYLITLAMFILGLMAKPTLVTLPFVMLLLDFWPLRRISGPQGFSENQASISTSRRLLAEKIPFFICSGIACLLTFSAEKEIGAVANASFPLSDRLLNVPLSYVAYLSKTFWPADLAIYYPFPESFSVVRTSLSVAFLFAISIAVVVSHKKFPFLVVGWFWFIGALVPMIGIVKIGSFAMADRYTYVPLIGVFIMLAYGMAAVTDRFASTKFLLNCCAVLFITFCGIRSFHEISRWQNNITLFPDSLWFTQHSAEIQAAIADTHRLQGRLPEARSRYIQALQLNPTVVNAHLGLGVVFDAEGKTSEAISEFKKALELKPTSYEANLNLALEFEKEKKLAEAITFYQRALELRPDSGQLHHSMGIVFAETGDYTKALDHFAAAIKHGPVTADLCFNFGNALLAAGKTNEAKGPFEMALQLQPTLIAAEMNLGMICHAQNDFQATRMHFEKVLKAWPNSGKAHFQLATVLYKTGSREEAVAHLERAKEAAKTSGQTNLLDQIEFWQRTVQTNHPAVF